MIAVEPEHPSVDKKVQDVVVVVQFRPVDLCNGPTTHPTQEFVKSKRRTPRFVVQCDDCNHELSGPHREILTKEKGIAVLHRYPQTKKARIQRNESLEVIPEQLANNVIDLLVGDRFHDACSLEVRHLLKQSFSRFAVISQQTLLFPDLLPQQVEEPVDVIDQFLLLIARSPFPDRTEQFFCHFLPGKFAHIHITFFLFQGRKVELCEAVHIVRLLNLYFRHDWTF